MLLKHLVKSTKENTETVKALVNDMYEMKREKANYKNRSERSSSIISSRSGYSNTPSSNITYKSAAVTTPGCPKLRDSALASIEDSGRSKTASHSRPSIRDLASSSSDNDNSREISPPRRKIPRTDGNNNPAKNNLTNAMKGKTKRGPISLSHYNFEEDFSPSEAADIERAILDPDVADDSDEDSLDLPLLGDVPSPNWVPNENSLKWFLKASDLELNSKETDMIYKKYKSSEDLEEHFSPAKIPSSLWNSIKANKSEHYKQKMLFKSQQNYTCAIKPLLDVLSNIPRQDKKSIENLTTAIQLISNGNLNLNRLRRSLVVPYIKKDLRTPLLATRVTHNHLFGTQFDKAAETAIKESSSSSKIAVATFRKSGPKSSEKPDSDDNPKFPEFKSRGRSFFRGKYKNNRSRGRGRSQSGNRSNDKQN